LLEDHAPPDTELLKVVVEDAHNTAVPEIDPTDGSGFTVTIVVVCAVPQPFVTEHEIVAVPADTPVTSPPLTVATDEVDEDQTPPDTDALKDVTEDAHTVAVPEIAPATGRGLTVTIETVAQEPEAYVINAVPSATPVTTPDELPIEATAGLPLVHVPPLVALPNVVVADSHTVSVPVIGDAEPEVIVAEPVIDAAQEAVAVDAETE